jgi:hypothetical protein
MREKYDLCITKYICSRSKCGMPIEIASTSLYEFAGPDDPAFWCLKCNDLPLAEPVGRPASDLPPKLQLRQGFGLLHVPRLKPSDDLDSANLLYRPYSQRSFLRQYIDWLKLKGIEPICEITSSATCFKKFDPDSQAFTDEIDYELVDYCDGDPCQFLRTETLKYMPEDELYCTVLKELCDIKGPYNLCQTRDEAQILRNFLPLTGSDHFPMLIPQPSLLSGGRDRTSSASSQSQDISIMGLSSSSTDQGRTPNRSRPNNRRMSTRDISSDEFWLTGSAQISVISRRPET